MTEHGQNGDGSGSGVEPAPENPVGWPAVTRWRRAARSRLAGLRDGLGQDGRKQASALIAAHLSAWLDGRGIRAGHVLSGYWPIRGEPDLRPLLAELHAKGVVIALPVVQTRAAPLIFRRWTPQTRMVRGCWNILVPPPEADELIPDYALAPCLGFTADCYRLGWGGGYFDRTLASLSPRPVTAGIAIGAARLDSIFPQAHDIPLCAIVTETGIAADQSRA